MYKYIIVIMISLLNGVCNLYAVQTSREQIQRTQALNDLQKYLDLPDFDLNRFLQDDSIELIKGYKSLSTSKNPFQSIEKEVPPPKKIVKKKKSNYQFRGFINVNNKLRFSIYNISTKKSYWLEDELPDLKIKYKDFILDDNVLILEINDKEEALEIKEPDALSGKISDVSVAKKSDIKESNPAQNSVKESFVEKKQLSGVNQEQKPNSSPRTNTQSSHRN